MNRYTFNTPEALGIGTLYYEAQTEDEARQGMQAQGFKDACNWQLIGVEKLKQD